MPDVYKRQEQKVVTTLVSGSVEFSCDNSKVLLKPGEQSVMNRTTCLLYTSGAFTLIQEGSFAPKHFFAILLLIINTALLSLIYPALYLVERLFGYTSEISLLEFSNPNHPALRNLTKKAPGTFQHSLMVANLAEEAIYHIGGSPLLARTGAVSYTHLNLKRERKA